VGSLARVEVDAPTNPYGVLNALAGFWGRLPFCVKDCFLCYEFNLFQIQRTKLKLS
jgi:hypothetical protein